jgi:hypothetical protein
MKRILIFISLLSILLIGADRPIDTIRLTIVNKSGMDIAIRLRSQDTEAINSKDVLKGEFYYLPVSEGGREEPTIKVFDIQKDTYVMQLLYVETYDPVYGYECTTPAPNALIARNNIRLVVLPCGFTPQPFAVGERTMRKYLPFPVKAYAKLFQKYWLTRLVY